jgi:hypothetical protein
LKNPFEQILITIALCGITACSDPQPIEPTNPSEEPKGNEEATPPPQETALTIPIVLIEELDQYQEFYKEQHTTSLSHARNKNWFSFRSGKDGILTKILLYGKPTVRITEYYGNSMSGFIREGNPSTGPKYGAWDLSRDDILNQLATQSLTEDDSGWITINMRGEIPQEIGKTYFLVCDKISEKSWFGDFAFGEGNPYPHGRIWFNPDHDLVFRTYVGQLRSDFSQTQGQPDRSQPGPKANSAPLPIPVPVQPLALEEKPIPTQPETFEERPQDTESIPLTPSPAAATNQVPPAISPQLTPKNLTPTTQGAKEFKENPLSEPVLPQTQTDQNRSQKNSLFNRLFKNR